MKIAENRMHTLVAMIHETVYMKAHMHSVAVGAALVILHAEIVSSELRF